MPERLKIPRQVLPPGESSYVLVVDDDIDLRASAVMLLQHEDIKTVGCANALAALRVIIDPRHPYPMCIFLDINMPVMTGWDLMATMNCMIDPIKRIPVILTTGERLPTNESRYTVLKKAYTLEQMMAIINDIRGHGSQ